MGLLSVLSLAHKWTSERVQTGDTVIDATAGNGVDTLFLCELAGPKGQVYAFDIQERALHNTRMRLERAQQEGKRLAPVELLLQSHDQMAQAVPEQQHGRVAAVLFNLGYLPDPNADPSLITRPQTTIAALESALALLRPGGLLSIVLYPGHDGGEEEAASVDNWARLLDPQAAQVAEYRMLQKPHAPYLIAIEKRKTNQTKEE
ncbi:class I SAM-dependent methyltransferase [Paenibacillus sp. GCM10012307]|uniref:Methyltransferase domain-containing protein n=1 Tax=Paenibacillus roseus TaxID=2798579 RepID=A0A934J6V9_9BACL|nr:class I SAM-dependent methyltransferase [Paenibacillus roseus]MBJ6361475.1 methyltransferase domain-containing protein [Paenibacillus roseus]